jgi:hypothetical protein
MKHNEQDTAWKEVLDAYLKDCLDYCLPELSLLIDWGKPFTSLDKELQAITRGNEAGKRLLDKLFKVHLKNGQEQWILIHLEVQGKPDNTFPKRMFIYGYRIYDKYQKPLVSCAILTDANKRWRPSHYEINFAGSYLRSGFLVVKLIDYEDKLSELEASRNPFASVILSQLAALKAQGRTGVQRKKVKFELTKRLYDKGFNKSEISNIYKFIDWLIGLPEPLEIEYLQDVYSLEESKQMPYISTAEKLGIKKGIELGIEQGMERGIKREKFIIAKRLLSEGVDPAFITKITELTLEEVEALKQKSDKLETVV